LALNHITNYRRLQYRHTEHTESSKNRSLPNLGFAGFRNRGSAGAGAPDGIAQAAVPGSNRQVRAVTSELKLDLPCFQSLFFAMGAVANRVC